MRRFWRGYYGAILWVCGFAAGSGLVRIEAHELSRDVAMSVAVALGLALYALVRVMRA